MTDFKPMLAKDAPADLAGLGWPQLAQPKYDGMRATVVGGRLLTRTLKEVPNREVYNALSRPEFEGLDGELMVGDPSDPKCFSDTMSFMRSSSKTGADWHFYVFDDASKPERPYSIRWMVTVQDRIRRNGRMRIVPSIVCHAPADVDQAEADFLAQGYEGLILRDPAAPYKHGRSGKKGPLLKVKRFVDFEAEAIGAYEEQHNGNERYENELGRGQRSSAKAGKIGKGTLGGLELRAINGPAEGIEFRCGTGFDAFARATLWEEAAWSVGLPNYDCDGLNGRVAKIKSFPIGVKDKPRHPVFLGWRDMELDS